MPCVVKECGRRGADGGDRAGFLVAAWVTRFLVGLNDRVLYRCERADYQMRRSVEWAKRSVPTIPCGVRDGGHGAKRLCPPYGIDSLTIPQPRGGAAAEHRDPVYRQ